MQFSPQTIRRLSVGQARPLIHPFVERTVHPITGLSGGLSCAGYDIHLGSVVEVIDRHENHVFTEKLDCVPGITDGGKDVNIYQIPPRTGVLGVTAERFTIPNNVCMKYYNKSTLARMFLNASATLAEPGWEGYLTLELYNATDKYITLYEGQPIGQVIFDLLDEDSDAPYSGKYQNQGAEPVQAAFEF